MDNSSSPVNKGSAKGGCQVYYRNHGQKRERSLEQIKSRVTNPSPTNKRDMSANKRSETMRKIQGMTMFFT